MKPACLLGKPAVAPLRPRIWRSVEVHDFDPGLLGPYDLAYQVLRAAVGGRTADPRSALAEPGEPSSLLWWQRPDGDHRGLH